VRRVVAVVVCAVVLLALVGGIALVRVYRIPSLSMMPAVESGDRVAVIRFAGPVQPDRGDVVAFRTPRRASALCGQGGVFLQRIVGLPGERVVSRRGRLFVDGSRLRERYVAAGRRGDVSGSWRVPRGAYLVLGDNRTQSCDSRVFGPVPEGNLIGQVFATYWPPDQLSFR
jgi:signal peptidase I